MTTIENDRHSGIARFSGSATRKVWDWPTRFVHWGLVVAFTGAYATNKLGANYFTSHLFFGYAVIVLVVFRLVWGFVGTRHARFANFVEGPRGVLRYVSAVGRGRRTRYAGHNPLGAVMVVSLLFALAVQATAGLFGNDEIFNAGPLSALVSKQASLSLTSLHRKLFYLILIAVGLHIGAVVTHIVWKREPLIRAMLTGSKPSELVPSEEAIRSSRGALAFILIAAIACGLAVGLHFVPSPDVELSSF